MNIMYAYDDNYAEIAAVSIKSLLETNKGDNHFYLIQDNVSSENYKKINDMIVQENATVTFMEKPDFKSLIGVQLSTSRWSDSAYSRLFLKELFGSPPVIDRLLYIDCDTLVLGALNDLYETDLDGYLGAACLECMSNMHKRIIGAKKTDNYVNTGMILFNVEKWIEEHVQDIAIKFIKDYKGKTEYVDQGVINGTVSNKFKMVSPKYNLTTLAYDFSYKEMQVYRKPSFGYTEEEWNAAKSNPCIVHFTTSFLSVRPWFKGCNHPYGKQWKEIHDRTPWKGNNYRILSNRQLRDKKELLYRKIPGKIAVRVVGFLHAYVKPILYVLKGKIR